MPVETSEEAAVFVKRWMNDRKVFKSDGSDKSKDTLYFSYEGASSIGINFSIQQPKNIVRVVGIVATIVFDSKQLEALTDLGAQGSDDFIKRLNDRLLFVNPTFVLGPKPEKPEWIMFIKEISYDELTEGRLIDAVDQVNRAVIFASSIIVDELGEPKTE